MASIAVLSNPELDGNKSHLARVREFCATRADILYVEVQRCEEIGVALNRISLAQPRVLVVNGGDGTVQAVLTELYAPGAPKRALPPIAVLSSGKTNLIAKELGATGDPIRTLRRVLEIARSSLASNIVSRQLISLDTGSERGPALGMFLAAGGLADVLLFCRHKVYPWGLPNAVSHLLTLVSGVISVLTERTARFLVPQPSRVQVAVGKHARFDGRFQVLMVTTLRTLVLTGKVPAEKRGMLQLLAIERRRRTALHVVVATLLGRLGKVTIPGVHLEMGDEIRIADHRAGVIMDGELFEPAPGKEIVLRPTQPVRFVDIGQGVHARAPQPHAPGMSEPAPQPAHAGLLSDAR